MTATLDNLIDLDLLEAYTEEVDGKYLSKDDAASTYRTAAQVQQAIGSLGIDGYSTKDETVKSITRNGLTFTATMADDTTFTFSQQDTTYGEATSSADGLMSSSDKAKLDGIAAGAQVNPGNATASSDGLMSSSEQVDEIAAALPETEPDIPENESEPDVPEEEPENEAEISPGGDEIPDPDTQE